MQETRGDDLEEEIWIRARTGDAESFGEIFDIHHNRVYGQALRLARNIHDAEDVTALTFLELWRRRTSVDSVDGSVIGWLLVTTNYVVRNLERTRRRHSAAMRRLPQPFESADHALRVQEAIDGESAKVAMRRAFRQLSTTDQDILTLCVLQELSEAQASSVLGIARGTVKSRLSRAKRRLADIIELSDQPMLVEGNPS